MSRYKTKYSRFFLTYAINDKAALPNSKNLGFEKIAEGQFWLFGADNLKGLPVDIGYRHKNGDGVYLRIEKSREYISFETDEMSGIPVFWSKTNNGIIIASDLRLLIRLKEKICMDLKIDLKAASEYLTTGYTFTPQKTLIQEVYLLGPRKKMALDITNGILKFEKLSKINRYSEARLDPQSAPMKFRNILEKNLKRHRGKKIALLLSGGGSSRILASCSIAAGLDVDFYTFGQSTVNNSDFRVANKVAYNLGKRTKCFSTSGENFLDNWKKMATYSNWINDSVWWAGRIPDSFFESLRRYDLVIRGDGDGCYGWGGNPANVSDIFHRFELTPNETVLNFEKYFSEPKNALGPSILSRNELVKQYSFPSESFLELKNILYREIRECQGASPGAWYFSRFVPIDTPFLWQKCLKLAFSLPTDKLVVRWIIFKALELDKKIKGIPRSESGSWDNQLEFYYTGVWEELLSYIKQYSPFHVRYDKLYADYVKPPTIGNSNGSFKKIGSGIKKTLLKNKYGRKLAFNFFPHLAHSSMSERLIIRLAMISNLCETLSKSQRKTIEASALHVM
jgi:hypothetical protein